MPLFVNTPYRVVRPEPRLDPMSKQLVQDTPYRVYSKRDENELRQMWKQKDPDIIEVSESHANQVIRRQRGYQEIPVEKFEAEAVKRVAAARRTRKSGNKGLGES